MKKKHAYLLAFLALSASSLAFKALILEAVGPALATLPLRGGSVSFTSASPMLLFGSLASSLSGLLALLGLFSALSIDVV